MFDRIFVTPRPQHVSVHETRTEVRAPTDASVALLKEMEAAARAKIVDAIEIKSTKFSATCLLTENFLKNRLDVTVICSINGERHNWDLAVDRYDSPEARMGKIRAEIVDRLAQLLLEEIAVGNTASLMSLK